MTFKKQDKAADFRRTWICEPKVGHQISFAKIIIEIKAIENDVLFWEEIPSSQYQESNGPTMIKDKAQRKAFIREHVFNKSS